ncbi:MAG: hypothetical protein ACKVIY_16730 [Acidimicrobiales bacterium]|jgi:hypothetical protein|tara:strand:+ start:160 stop:372 length:213 start_codon:yes stop_codon:yes gene_type:complete
MSERYAILGVMNIRPKLSAAPLGYTLTKVDGAAEAYKAFGTALWSDEAAVPVRLKELVFLRTSMVNQCLT